MASGDMSGPCWGITSNENLGGGLQARLGEAAWTLFDNLHKNGMVMLGPNAQAINPVLQGAKSAVFGAVDYVAYGAAANGESVKVIFPSSGTVIAPRPMMILKSSHAQADARDDIDTPRPRLKDLKLLPQDGGGNTKSRTEVLSRFNALFGEH